MRTMHQVFKRVNARTFIVLLAAGLLGVFAILPYMMEFIEFIRVDRAQTAEMPMPFVVALALVQNGILLAIAIFVGMRLSERVGLKMPLIRAWTAREPKPQGDTIVKSGLVVGAAAGAALVAVEAIAFLRHLPEAMQSLFTIPLWKRLLAGVVYGGITEELLMRLFLLSLVAWLLGKRWRTATATPTPAVFRTAIVVAALVFALGHLPATAALAPLTPLLVVRSLLLNGIAGVAFGYLYWKHGLEAAMLGHMSAHLVMQIPGAMLLQSMLDAPAA